MPSMDSQDTRYLVPHIKDIEAEVAERAAFDSATITSKH